MSDVKFDLSDHADVMATWLEGQPDIPPGVVNTLRDLAAEVRALRKDRERLDWMQRMNSEVFWINAKLCEVTLGLTIGSGEADELRAAIDAALSARSGEDAAMSREGEA